MISCAIVWKDPAIAESAVSDLGLMKEAYLEI
jgi:hypothetical protein